MMRRKTTRVVVAAVGVLLAVPLMASAQTLSWKDVQVADIEGMKDKFIGLAEAFDESQYSWAPMDGAARSVHEVLALAVAEANLFPGLWGATAPVGAAAGFEAEMNRVGGLGKSDVIRELGTSFDFLIAQVRDMTDAKRMADGAYFGRTMPNHAVVATAMTDMHEHLGQLIAYARTNRIVPPWSR